MPSLSLRINLDPEFRIGPGKIQLLEAISKRGSISAAARQMGMSYKRAWDLVEELNRMFGSPVLDTQKGGPKGGGATLTATGQALVTRFRAIEQEAHAVAATHLRVLQSEIGER